MNPRRNLQRLLVAARGVPALRVARSAREAGVETVVLVDDCDAESAWPDRADFAGYVEGASRAAPPLERVVAAAMDAGCDAVFPSWGPLARSTLLGAALQEANLGGPGPTVNQLAAVADRTVLRTLAEGLQIPVVPGSGSITDASEARTWLSWTGLPAMVHPADESAGAGGTRIDAAAEAGPAIDAALACGPVVLERLVVGAREIEVPLCGDGGGRVFLLADRDVTARHRGERTLVEAPAAGLSPHCRQEMRAAATRLAAHLLWLGFGAARFLVTPDGRPYLLAFRPGFQAWDAATEAVLGVDLVAAALRIAAGEPLGWSDEEAEPRGSALSARVVAGEAGVIEHLEWPEGCRVDGGPEAGDAVLAGDEVGVLTVTAPSRRAAIVRLATALDAVAVEGVATSLPCCRVLAGSQAFWEGPLDRDAVRTVMGGD